MYADLTVEENLHLWAAVRGVADSHSRAAAVVESLGLAPFAGRRVRHCSQGIARRATLATAFLTPARLLLLDEPFANLDADAQERVTALIRERRASGAAVVVASHEPDFIASQAGRVIALDRGRISAVDDSPGSRGPSGRPEVPA